MLEDHESGARLAKSAYAERVPALRAELLRLQFELRGRDFAVLLMLGGDDRLGTQDLLNRLHEWLDPRLLATQTFTEPRPEEAVRPFFWRYWRALPARGQIGVFYRGWLTQTLAEHVRGELGPAALDRRVRHARAFERMLVDDGVLLIKLWLHLPRRAHKKRLREADGGGEHAWRVLKQDRRIYRHYRRSIRVLEDLLKRTHTREAPWWIVESSDARYRDVTASELVRAALESRLAAPEPREHAPPRALRPVRHSPLASVDLSAKLSPEKYESALLRWQSRLSALAREAYAARIATVLVFEGWDAAGKGGAIRRVAAALDAGTYRVHQYAAPGAQERAYPYLWRFWRDLPRDGRLTLFDRSWYGRVLVERIEGFARLDEWARAYDEIRSFEDQLCAHGTVVVKFWLHIDPETQLERFRARERSPFKMYKITDEDYRNRERWDEYAAAADEMIARTHTARAPWRAIAANDKRYARVRVLREICARLERAL